jgi:hypothetical protein
MNTKYVLIDHENVQPKDLALLDGQPLRVIVFLGANQARLSADLAIALQARGENGRYVRINANGRNALDFHIAFYLGELATKEPSASFHVISKDDGYDPLLEHWRSRGIEARRSATLASLVLPQVDDTVADAIVYLQSAGTARPRRRKTLGNAINTRRGNKLEQAEIERVIAELVRHRVISVTDDKVVYP